MRTQQKIKAQDLAIQGGKPVRKNILVFGRPDVGDEEAQIVSEIVKSRWLGVGPKVSEFENKIRDYIGSVNAVATNSASAAIHIALLAANIGKGDEVVTSPITFPSTVNMIENVGAKPVFADVDLETGQITPETITKVVTSKTKAILPVHLHGRPSDMSGINDLAKKKKLVIIEDAAEAFGAEYKGKMIGSESDFAAFSFAVNKVITTAEGGVLVTNNPDMESTLKRYVVHGMDKGALKKYPYRGYMEHFVELPGLKYNMTDIHAGIGLVQLPNIDILLATREKIAGMYDEAFKDLPVRTPKKLEEGMRHGRCFYAVNLELSKLTADRDTIQEALLAENIGSAVHFYPMHLQPYYSRKYGYKKGDLPNAESFSESTLSLPFTSELSVKDVNYVIIALRKVLSYFSK